MSFRRLFRCTSCCRSSRRDEQIAIWVSVGTVFTTLFVTTVLAPSSKGDEAETTTSMIESQPTTESEASLSPARLQEHLESFDIVWSTINDRHWDPAHLESVGWEAARDELRPKVEEATTDDEAIGAMAELVERVQLSHYQIIPGEAYDEDLRAGGSGITGIELRMLDGAPTVFRIAEDSPAQRAGVQTGWIVEAVGGDSLDPVLERLRLREEATGERPGVIASLALEGRLRGPVGETLAVRFRDGDDATREIDITLEESPDPEFSAANLPPSPVSIRFDTLNDRIGYFSFNLFMDPGRLMSEFQRAVDASRDLDGLVIDLRGNGGGIIMLCNGIGGWLLTDTPSAELGRLTTRQSDLKLIMNRRANPLNKPVAVLIDERSISSAEILSGGLKDTGVARVFGSVSAGMSLPSVIEKLPNGTAFQYAFANYTSASGRELEKNGVEPHVTVPLTRSVLLAGEDPALEAAIDWIDKQAN